VGVDSDAGVRGQIVFSSPAEAVRAHSTKTAIADRLQITSTTDNDSSRRLVAIQNSNFSVRVSADEFKMQQTAGTELLEFRGEVRLEFRNREKSQSATLQADAVRIEIQQPDASTGESMMQLTATNASVRMSVRTGKSNTINELKCDELKAVLSASGTLSGVSSSTHPVFIAMVYSVADLVVPLPLATAKLVVRADGSVLQEQAEPTQNPAIRSQELIDLIQATVAPESWQGAGGSGRVVLSESTLSLVVSATPEVHDEIAELLNQLRRLQDAMTGLEVAQITLPEDGWERIGVDLDIRRAKPAEVGGLASASLSARAAAALQKIAISSLPPVKMTVANGQACQLRWVADDKTMPSVTLSTVVSADRRHVRISSMDSDSPAEPVKHSIASGDSLLFLYDNPANPSNKTYLLVTARVIVQEEEEARSVALEATKK
ncbi:MAG: hypothetical protein KDA96_25645, partial [Planctomycetaceae bacterium]|nr:hypothetical protein [Planctomycetaceae bacterium]